MSRTLVAIVAAWFLLAVSGAGQQQKPPAPKPPTFRSSVDLITVDVSVLDRDRRPVKGLAAGDFVVLEDGKPQDISTFTAVDLPDTEPTTVAWVRAVAPDVGRNDDLKDRRLVVIVLDDATPMPQADGPKVRTIARKVVEQLGPHDLAAVVYTFAKKQNQDFTSDRVRLLAAVDRFNGAIATDSDLTFTPGGDAAASRRVNPTPNIPMPRIDYRFDEFDPNAMTMYQSVIATIEGVSKALAALPERRKSLFFISVGLPFDPEQASPEVKVNEGDASRSLVLRLVSDLQAAFDAARRANVNVYGVDPGGLRGGQPVQDKNGNFRSVGLLNRDFLKAVAANTGGAVIAETNVPDAGITQVFRENASYYLLGYEPSNARASGRFRKIEVKVKQPDVTVRARSGYREARAEDAGAAPPPPIAGILPKSDVALQLSAAPFAIPDRRESALAIVLRLRQPTAERETAAQDEITVNAAAYDDKGNAAASERVTMRLTRHPGPASEVQLEMLSRLDVKPGRYQVRIAAASALDAKTGTVFADVDVPDFAGPAVSLSGVLVSAAGGTVARKDLLASLVPVVPTALRDFAPGETVGAFVRVYQGASERLAAVTVTAYILDAAGGRVFDHSETLGPERFATARAADYSIELPLARLQPGPHLLTIEVTAGKAAARRDVRFQITQ